MRPDQVRAGLTLVLLEVPEAGRMLTVSASRLEVGDDLEAYAAARQPFRDEVARLAARYAETRRDPDTTPEQLLSASRAVRAATEADRSPPRAVRPPRNMRGPDPWGARQRGGALPGSREDRPRRGRAAGGLRPGAQRQATADPRVPLTRTPAAR